MIHIYCGDGKGKTTAAIGLSIRAVGAEKKVIFAQFMKGNDSSEIGVLKNIDNIKVLKINKNFGFYKKMSEDDKKNIKILHNNVLDKIDDLIKTKNYDVLILDEIISAYNHDLLNREHVIKILEHNIEIIMTGRNPDKSLTSKADYISRIEKIKHPFDRGIKSRKGIEF